MRLKRWLMLAPLVLIVGLVQAYFWVPSYETQIRGNPERATKFIEASIGDAKILNPILNADTASSRIADLVFDGLLDLDENLKLRGRLATDWSIGETVYLLVNSAARFPDGTPVTPEKLQARVNYAVAHDRPAGLKNLVQEIKLLAPGTRVEKLDLPPGKDGKPNTVELLIRLPARLELTLKQVDQDFFKRLEPVIGAHYAQNASLENWIDVTPAEQRAAVLKQLPELLPVLEHNPTILFHLRRGVQFHDGQEFSADDVKFTYEAIMNPKNLSPRTSDFEPIKTVEIVDRYTVRMVYKRLFSPAIDAWTMGILPQHLLNEKTLQAEMERRGLSSEARRQFGVRDSEFNRRPVGTGPFRFKEWQSDVMIHLLRHEKYWEGAPRLKDFYYRVIPDTLTQEVEFRTGAVDTYGPEPHQAARYRADPAYQSFSAPSFGYTYIGYNNRRPLFADKRVRQALGMAIDADEIIKYVLYGEGERTTGPFPINTDWHDRSVKPLPYDPAGALRILESLGWKRNAEGWLEKDGKIFEFNLLTNQGNAVRKAVLTIAQNDWRKIGIKCHTQVFEWAVFLQDFIDPGQFDAIVMGWRMGIDPDLYQVWHSSQSGPKQLNFVGYNNPEADALILRIRQEYDVAEQRKLTHRLHQVIAEDQPYTFLVAPRATTVLDKKFVVMREDGTYSRITPARSGSVMFDFNKWQKLAMTPSF